MSTAPRTLQIIDTQAGTGKVAAANTVVTVNYSGWIYQPMADKQHGLQFDRAQAGSTRAGTSAWLALR